MLFCTNIWKRQVLLVHANLDDKDIRYSSTCKKQQMTTIIFVVFSVRKF
jgi:hypothetical protein